MVNKAPTVVTYTGQTSTGWNQTLTLSSVLKTSSGTPIAGQTVVETLGTGRSAQSCSAVTNSSGVASCTVQVDQVNGSVTVTVSYAGNSLLPVVLDVVLRGGRLRTAAAAVAAARAAAAVAVRAAAAQVGAAVAATLPPPKTGGLGCG